MSDEVKRGGFRPAPPTTLPSAPPPPPIGLVCRSACCRHAGYGDDKLDRLIDFLRRQPRTTLASGEGALLLAEIDRLRSVLASVRAVAEEELRWIDARPIIRALDGDA